MNEHFNIEFKLDSLNEDGEFVGYGSTFGGDPDSYGDVIERGAFTETLAKGGRNGTGVAMLWQHNSSEPIGTWPSIKEDRNGLLMRGKLIREVTKGNDAYHLMKGKAIQALSIGFSVNKGDYVTNKHGGRNLKKVSLWEVSPVTFPANTRAKITNIKQLENATTPRELERILRESGLSRQEAMYMVKLAKPSLSDSSTDMKGLLDALVEINKN